MEKRYYAKARGVLNLTLGLNLFVVVLKLIVGFAVGSLAMIADGFHSLLDSASNIIGLIGLSVASKPADKTHPYGHRKFETLTTIVIAMFLFLTGFEILENALKRLHSGQAPLVTFAAFSVLAGTLLINLFVTYYERRKGVEYSSSILLADSSHTASDVLVTISVLISFVVVKLGYPMADPLIAVAIALVIWFTGFKIIRDTASVLTDSAAIDTSDIAGAVQGIEGITGCHKIRTRSVGDDAFVDMHIMTKPYITVRQGHNLAKKVERVVKKKYPKVKDVTIHVDPTHKVRKP
ncbi:MAG: cation diffusion facilitator family transporter [Candidatus Woesearchaeota archaeon]